MRRLDEPSTYEALHSELQAIKRGKRPKMAPWIVLLYLLLCFGGAFWK
jgi:hypothetical protein